jgi:DNA polymerase/3'-5' exonuclease PolX
MDFDNNILVKDLKPLCLTKISELVTCYSNLKTINLVNNIEDKTSSFKVLNYKKWLRILELLDNDIFKNKDLILKAIKSNSLKDKIKEINNTNNLKTIKETNEKINKLEKKSIETFNEKKTNKNNSFKKIENYDIINLQKIYNIGEKTAILYLKKGIKVENLLEEWSSLKDKCLFPKFEKIEQIMIFFKGLNNKKKFIKTKFSNTQYLKELNYGQLIGIKYFNDIQERIPRKEIEYLDKILKHILKDKDIEYEICGSYRRGCSDSGDIDILLTSKDTDKNYLVTFIYTLIKLDILKDHLTMDGNKKYMGMLKVPSKEFTKYRRVDIIFKNYDNFAPSLLYFTGSANLNKERRKKAISKGYKLNEYGLFIKKTDEKLDTPTEKTIFDLLEMKYLEPIKRNN